MILTNTTKTCHPKNPPPPKTPKTNAVVKSNASLDAITSGIQGITMMKGVKFLSTISTDPHTIQTFSEKTPDRIRCFIEVDIYIGAGSLLETHQATDAVTGALSQDGLSLNIVRVVDQAPQASDGQQQNSH